MNASNTPQPPPKYGYILITRILHGKKNFADVIKLLILDREILLDYPFWSNIIRILLKLSLCAPITQLRLKDKVLSEAEKAALFLCQAGELTAV